MNIKVKSVLLPIFGEVNEVSLMVMNFSVLATTCEVNYNLYDKGKYLIGGQLIMDEVAFEMWGQDNGYVVDWALEKLGLEKAEFDSEEK